MKANQIKNITDMFGLMGFLPAVIITLYLVCEVGQENSIYLTKKSSVHPHKLYFVLNLVSFLFCLGVLPVALLKLETPPFTSLYLTSW